MRRTATELITQRLRPGETLEHGLARMEREAIETGIHNERLRIARAEGDIEAARARLSALERRFHECAQAVEDAQ